MVHLKDVLTPEMIKNLLHSSDYQAQEGQGSSQTGYKNVTFNGKNNEHLQIKYNLDNTPHFVGMLPADFHGKHTAKLCGCMVEFARIHKCTTTQELADKLCKDKTINPSGRMISPVVTPVKDKASSNGSGKAKTTPTLKPGKSIKKVHKTSKASGSKNKFAAIVDDEEDTKEDSKFLSNDEAKDYIKKEAKSWRSAGWISDEVYDSIKSDVKECWLRKKSMESDSDSDSD